MAGKRSKLGSLTSGISAPGRAVAMGGFSMGGGFRQVLEQVLPRRSSPNQIACADLPLGYLAGIFPGGTKLAHCAQLRIDPLLPEMLGVKRLGSQSSYSRFGQFDLGPG